jgi:hypothetical protein
MESGAIAGVLISGNDTTLPDCATSVIFPAGGNVEVVHAINKMKAQSIDNVTDFCFTDAKVHQKKRISAELRIF